MIAHMKLEYRPKFVTDGKSVQLEGGAGIKRNAMDQMFRGRKKMTCRYLQLL